MSISCAGFWDGSQDCGVENFLTKEFRAKKFKERACVECENSDNQGKGEGDLEGHSEKKRKGVI